MTKKELFNVILVHVARTWERIRVERPHKEMPMDNIESVETIIHVAHKILNEDKVIKGFNRAKDKSDYFVANTDMLSDTYIESVAEKIIINEYLLD